MRTTQFYSKYSVSALYFMSWTHDCKNITPFSLSSIYLFTPPPFLSQQAMGFGKWRIQFYSVGKQSLSFDRHLPHDCMIHVRPRLYSTKIRDQYLNPRGFCIGLLGLWATQALPSSSRRVCPGLKGFRLDAEWWQNYHLG